MTIHTPTPQEITGLIVFAAIAVVIGIGLSIKKKLLQNRKDLTHKQPDNDPTDIF